MRKRAAPELGSRWVDFTDDGVTVSVFDLGQMLRKGAWAHAIARIGGIDGRTQADDRSK